MEQCLDELCYEDTFSAHDARIRFLTNAKDHLEWSRHYLGPYFYSTDDHGLHDYTVGSFVGKAFPSNLEKHIGEDLPSKTVGIYLRQTGNEFANDLDQGSVFMIQSLRGSHIYLHSRIGRTILFLSRGSEDRGQLEEGRLVVARILRDLITKRLEEKGFVMLHGGAVAFDDDHGIGILGDKGAGKTSLVIGLLSSKKARFISNDKVLVGDLNGCLVMVGWPTTPSIAVGTMSCYDQFRQFFFSVDGTIYPQLKFSPNPEYLNKPPEVLWKVSEKLELTPRELAALFNVDICVSSEISGLFFPSISVDSEEIRINELDEKRSRVRIEESFLLDDPDYPDFLHLRTCSRDHLESTAQTLAGKLARRIRCFEVFGGGDAIKLGHEISRLL